MEMNPELRPIVEKARASALGVRMVNMLGKPLRTEGEIRPTDMAPVLAPDRGGSRTVFPMVWGYSVPGLRQPVVNARIENAKYKLLWKDGWASHRCVIPASWYFEWEHLPAPGGKTKVGRKYMIQPRGAEITWLAGLYRIEEYRGLKYPVFSVLTMEPADAVRRLHDRMPLILPSSAIDDWIRPDKKAEETARWAITDLILEVSEQA